MKNSYILFEIIYKIFVKWVFYSLILSSDYVRLTWLFIFQHIFEDLVINIIICSILYPMKVYNQIQNKLIENWL